MLLVERCPLCGAAGSVFPCPACVAALPCSPVLALPPGLDGCRALFAYTGPGRDLVVGLKYRNHRGVVPWLADRLAAELVATHAEVVTWAPTTARRRRHRGFDQSEVLARRAARRASLPVARCLTRVSGPPQTGRSIAERREGPCFDARRGVAGSVAGRRVALVDDVVTSGATVARAAVVLRAAGAASVVAVAVAGTTRGHSGGP